MFLAALFLMSTVKKPSPQPYLGTATFVISFTGVRASICLGPAATRRDRGWRTHSTSETAKESQQWSPEARSLTKDGSHPDWLRVLPPSLGANLALPLSAGRAENSSEHGWFYHKHSEFSVAGLIFLGRILIGLGPWS